MADVAFKEEAHRLVDELPDDASWKDLVYRAAVRADIEVALADSAAGRVIDGDAVLRWVESWGTDHELPPPHRTE